MKFMADSDELGEKSGKLPEIKENLTVFRNKARARFSLVYWIAWYRQRRYPREEVNLVHVKDSIDHNLIVWVSGLSSWIFHVLLTGGFFYFLAYIFFSPKPPWFLIFPFGVFWWVFLRAIRDVSRSVRLK